MPMFPAHFDPEPPDPIDYVNIDRRFGDLDLHLDIEHYQSNDPNGEFRYGLDGGCHTIEEKRGDRWVTVALEVDAIEDDEDDYDATI